MRKWEHLRGLLQYLQRVGMCGPQFSLADALQWALLVQLFGGLRVGCRCRYHGLAAAARPTPICRVVAHGCCVRRCGWCGPRMCLGMRGCGRSVRRCAHMRCATRRVALLVSSSKTRGAYGRVAAFIVSCATAPLAPPPPRRCPFTHRLCIMSMLLQVALMRRWSIAARVRL